MAATRVFEVTATAAGARTSPPNATMDALQMPRYPAASLFSERIYVQNFGNENVELRSSADLNPANAAAATITHKILYPGQGDYLTAWSTNANTDTGYDVASFFAFSESADCLITVDPQ